MKNIPIAVIGYGAQGMAVSCKLKQSGHYTIQVYDIDSQRLELAASHGLIAASCIAEAVKNAAYILITVTAGSSIKQLLLDSNFLGCITPKQIIIQMGSYSVSDALSIAKEYQLKQIPFLECILSGPSSSVMAGTCTLLVGGNKKYLDKLKTVFQPIGNLNYLGEVGKAAAFNLACLNMIYALVQSFAISTAIVDRNKLDLDCWFNFLKSGFDQGADNFFKLLTDYLWPVHFKKRNYQLTGPVQIKARVAADETELIAELVNDLQLNTLLIDAINRAQQNAQAVNEKDDWSSIYEVLVPPNQLS